MPDVDRKPPSWFKEPPQLRQDLGSEDELRNLGESLRHRQLAPVGAMADGRLLYGFRRLRAAKMVGLTELAVMIYSEELSPTEINVIQLTENFHRLDMNPYEKWNAFDGLRQLNPKWGCKELADHLKVDASSITKWLSPSKCIVEWREALRKGVVGISDVYVASQVSEEQQRALLELKLSGGSRDALTREVRRSRPRSKDRSVRVSRIMIALPCGTKVVMSGGKLSLKDVVEKLGECASAARKGLQEKLDARTFQDVMRVKSQSEREE